MAETGRLALYHFDGCYYCGLVRDAADDLGVVLELRDIHDGPEHRDALVGVMGRQTVPVLCIEHPEGQLEWVPESADIIRYLAARVGRRPLLPKTVDALLGPVGWGLLLGGIVAEDHARPGWIAASLTAFAVRGLTRPGRRSRQVGVLSLAGAAVAVAVRVWL